jgi:LPS-assembly protein
MRWPFTPALRFVGRWNYSTFLEKTVDAFGGLEYGPCCWTLRAIARHFIKDRNGGSNTIYMVQLELTGLGKVGHQVEDFLERGIYGYQQE